MKTLHQYMDLVGYMKEGVVWVTLKDIDYKDPYDLPKIAPFVILN